MSKKEVINILRRYCNLLAVSGIPVEKAFLYGSYSRGTPTIESDMDILIVSSVFDQLNDTAKAKAWRLTDEVDHRIEPYLIGMNRFLTDDISPILQIVKKEGIEIKLT